MSVKKAVIPIGGFATRFLPACKSVPKCMLNVVDKPMIQYIVDEATDSGIEDIILIIGRKKEVVIDYFTEDEELKKFLRERGKENFISQIEKLSGKANVHFIEQKEAKGLGHAVYQAKNLIGNEPFAIMYGDVVMKGSTPCLKEMINKHEEVGSSVIGVERVEWTQISKYGAVEGEDIGGRTHRVTGLVEKPKMEEAKTNLAVLDRHVIMPEIFDVLENMTPGHGGEIQITDAYNELAKKENGMYAYEYFAKRFDGGDKLGFVKLIIDTALERDDLKEDLQKYLEEIKKIK
jgi:UDP-glucose pyrophosphorylase